MSDVIVKMKTTEAGPDGCFPEGTTRRVSREEAKSMMAAGIAEIVASVPDEKPAPAAKTPERADSRRPTRTADVAPKTPAAPGLPAPSLQTWPTPDFEKQKAAEEAEAAKKAAEAELAAGEKNPEPGAQG